MSIALSAMLTACFTGIESTPRITADDVRRSAPSRLSAEESYLADIQPEKLSDWKAGKAFYVTDPRIGLAMNIAPAGASLAAGDTLRFREAADVTSIMGEPAAELTFDGPRGITATFRSDVSMATLKSMPSVTVPFTVDLSLVGMTAARLAGKEFWIVSDEWLDLSRQPRRGRKFVRAKVTAVDRGDDVYPVCLTVVDLESSPADTFMLLMALGNGEFTSSRRFASFFSLDDPHKRYPQINDRMWNLIRNGKTGEGMTRLEVRLALGEPRDVQRRAGYSSLGEIWTYDNGRYLLFEDGLLKQAR